MRLDLLKSTSRKTDIITIIVFILLIGGIIFALFFSGKGRDKSKNLGENGEVTIADFNGKRAGVPIGAVHDDIIRKNLPDSEITEYNGNSDMITALLSDRIDYFLMVEDSAETLAKENQDLAFLSEPIDTLDIAVAFPKTEKGDLLREQMDEFITKLIADGTMDEIYEYWGNTDNPDKSIDMSGLTGKNGKLAFATTGSMDTISFISNGKAAGSDIDIAVRFCREYGYDIDIKVLDFGGIIPGLATGTYDFALNNIFVTPEREESVYFSVPYQKVNLDVVVRKSDLPEGYAAGVPDVKRLGIRTGTSFEQLSFEYFPDKEYYYYDTDGDLLTALISNKIDGFLEDEPVGAVMHMENPDVDYIRKPIVDDDYYYGFPKDTPESDKLKAEFNETVEKLKESGELDVLRAKWVGSDESIKTCDTDFKGENGTIRVVLIDDTPPVSYIKDNKLCGYAVDLTMIFVKEHGYSVEFEITTPPSSLAGLSSGKYDMLASLLSYTEERAQNIDYSDKVYEGGITMVMRAEDIPQSEGTSDKEKTKKSWLSSIKDSFHRNFIRESRYKLILQGILTTCIITLMSTLFGSVLAFLVCLYRRTGSRLANAVANLYVKLLQGTPIVVLLMILYYVIFGKSDINAIWVAIIGFSLNFGAYTSEVMRSGIESIDGGQREAALALGYTENQAFFKFIFPQAAVRFLPVYRGEIISLLKGTSIVGYIAIQDLTKMSDIIRSRTYEAFFPLIATAVIYFVLAWVLALILKLILNNLDPKRRKKAKEVK